MWLFVSVTVFGFKIDLPGKNREWETLALSHYSNELHECLLEKEWYMQCSWELIPVLSCGAGAFRPLTVHDMVCYR